MIILILKIFFFDWSIIGFMVFLYIGVLFVLFFSNFSWIAVGLVLFLYWVIGGLGIILGFYCMFIYCSFKIFKWFEYFFIFCGIFVCEGGVCDWVGLYCIYY